jgi:Xaa-Pro aminopeptidase
VTRIEPPGTLRHTARAEAVMDRLGVDALLALQPHHVLYLTNHVPRTLNVRWDVSYAALLPRDPARPVGLVVQALELLFVAGEPLAVDLIESFLAPLPDEAALEAHEPPAVTFPGFPVRADVESLPVLREKLAISRSHGSRAAPTAAHALARLIRAAGLERGRLLADDARAPLWLAEAGLTHASCRYDPAAFKEIRLVKTAAEIERLREAAVANEAACRAAAAGAGVGMTQDELEMRFVCECARRGNWAAYLVSDLGRLPHGAVASGEPLMLDALSSRHGYYGDFGRTLVIGDVSAELRRRAGGLDAAWAAAEAAICPGADYDTVRHAAVAGARAAGFPEFGLPVAHSVGLQHTDDPAPPRLHTGINPNRALEPGMVLNLDMPFIEWGWGALHREDTVLVTDSGCERLTSGDETLIVVSA